MSDESARLEALLEAVPIFAALQRVELARLVGSLEDARCSFALRATDQTLAPSRSWPREVPHLFFSGVYQFQHLFHSS
jgi:hypothetical protein